MNLVESVLEGNRRALARLLTEVDNGSPEGRKALDALFPNTGKAHLIGVTGAPGTGKSTLINQIVLQFRKPSEGEPKKVAVVAVDPSSPFTGGAVLGDRIRMRDHAVDKGVFIRSAASRGSLGGLAQTTAAMVQVFDAAGFDVILIETVGAGQAEVDIARLAHTTLVVEAPGLGDNIQAIKAGILEIADILVVNKADNPGVENTERALRGMLELAHPVEKIFRHHGEVMYVSSMEPSIGPMWMTPIVRMIATDGTGVKDLMNAIDKHHNHLRESGDWGRREWARLEVELDTLIRETLHARFRDNVSDNDYNNVLNQIIAHEISPWEAVKILLTSS